MKKVSLQYQSSYVKDSGNGKGPRRNYVYAVVGNADAVAQYVTDKENSDLGRCPMMSDADGNDTDVPRFTTQELLGANATLERSAKGAWFTPADELSLLNDAISTTANDDVRRELALGAADLIREKIKAQVRAGRSAGAPVEVADSTPVTKQSSLSELDNEQ